MIAVLWVWAAAGVPTAVEDPTPVLSAALAEAKAELSLPDAPTPYHLRATVFRVERD